MFYIVGKFTLNILLYLQLLFLNSEIYINIVCNFFNYEFYSQQILMCSLGSDNFLFGAFDAF